MPHSAEGQAFLTRLAAAPDEPGFNLDGVLQPSLDEEQELRKLFAQDKTNTRLANPHVGLVDVFGSDTELLRKTRARVVDSANEEDLSGKYIMPLTDAERREYGEASMVADITEFNKNWSIFTEGSLSQLFDWSNVVAAGGAVLSALSPLPENSKKSKRAIRKYYHSTAYPSSDVDLFLWGLTPEQAEKKIVAIYEAVRDSVPWDVTCVRTKHTISIHSQYPYRSVQIVLRLYRSPAEVLAGFDIDAPCCAYDGERVWANPRAIMAMIRQCNTVDVTRRSPSYEVRLAKYSKRGFEVYVPNLMRKDIDPTIYERSIIKIEGLARLLALEKLQSADARYKFLDSRRELRGRPFALRQPKNRKQRKYHGDLKKTEVGGLEMNDYDVASLHIPYGPGWTSQRIEKLIYQTDLGMNSTFNPKNKGRRLHRHTAFFGTIEECMEDCCENCPDPIDDDERTLQKEEDEHYIRDRISFIQENPGRQSLSGSFNPIDEGEWSEQVYVRPIQKLFNAIAAHDIDLVRALLDENRTTPTIDLQHRDHVGRTALHLAILVKDEEIAKVLVDEGCRMIARLVDGRTALHLAAQYGIDSLIEKMFERTKQNKEAAEKEKKTDEEDAGMKTEAGPPDTATETERPSSEDDWSSDENDGKDDHMDVDEERGDSGASEGSDGEEGDKPKEENPDGEVPEDEEDEPDVLDVSVRDWDQGFAPLHYAVLYGTRSTVDLLLRHEADPTQAAVASNGNSWEISQSPLPLFLTIVRPDEDIAVDIAERLLEAGTSSSTADEELITMLHYAVLAQKTKILDMFLRTDSGAKMALDFPWVQNGNSRFPVVTAVAQGAYASLLTLLAHGAKINPTGADVTRAKAISGKTDTRIWGYGGVENYSTAIYQPVETALARGDYIIVPALLEAGVNVNNMTFTSLRSYKSTSNKNTIFDWVVDGLKHLENSIESAKDEIKDDKEVVVYTPLEKANSWKEYFDDFCQRHSSSPVLPTQEELERKRKDRIKRLESLEKTREYLQHIHSTLKLFGAKTWKEVYEEPQPTTNFMDSPPASKIVPNINVPNINVPPKPKYKFLSKIYYRHEWVQHDLNERYDALFEAAFRGDDAKIEKLCVPSAEETDASVVPVQITVEAILLDDQSASAARYNTRGSGLTPLHAAIAGKRWNTAKLIMGIAGAQYHDDSDDDQEEKWRVSLFDLVDEDGEGDDDDEMSTYSDSTVDGRERQAKFVDIAKKITIRTDLHPSLLLNRQTGYMVDNNLVNETLQERAIRENNFEAFIHLFDIQESLGTTNNNQEHPFFSTILQADNPKFLDELIRRTGVGIDVETVRQTSGEDHPIALNDQNRLYLGLNIHGKKRADLARRGDPNAPGQGSRHIPILWNAIGLGAKSIVEYLASEKPLSAYKHFAANGEGDKAEWLRHSKTIESSLGEWLGWNVSPIGENPLTVAISRNQKEILPILFSKAAKLMGSVLHAKIKFSGFNGLLFAAAVNCDKEIFDFLLKKGVSVAESDSERGWNIYHWVCSNKQLKLLEYLLERLPRDVSEDLLLQRSKTKLDTPLQIAIKLGAVPLVKAILGFTQNGLLMYDAYGFTPLHNAIRKGHPLIAEEILKVIPQEGLYLENGVGKTPYEDAQKRAMRPVTYTISKVNPSVLEYSSGVRPTHMHLNIDALEKELQKVVDSLNRLVRNGTLEKGSQLANTFEKFVSATEGRLAKEKARAAETAGDSKGEDDVHTDARDPIETFKATAKAVQSDEAKRTLIHLKDVQLSVETDLQRVAHEVNTYSTNYTFGDEEEGDKEKERGNNLLFAGFTINHYT